MADTKEYLVTWTIQLEATSYEHAATLAREIQLDRDSTATVFKVQAPEDVDGGSEVDVADLPDQSWRHDDIHQDTDGGWWYHIDDNIALGPYDSFDEALEAKEGEG